MEFPMNKFGEPQAENIRTAEYSNQGIGITINSLAPNRSNYINLLKPPEISSSFRKNLIVGSEINELLSNNVYFKYILLNILKIVNDTLEGHGSTGHVEVALETDEDNPKWRHADITVKLDDDSMCSEIWRKASKGAKDFYKSLEASKMIPHETIRVMHRFIYIIVD